MRKFIAIVAISLMSLTAMATDYKDTLVVTLNGQTTYTSAIISLASQNNGTYTLSLNNFIFKYNGTTTNLGTITFADCKAKETDRGLLLEENVKTTIEAGNISGLRWKGPSYGELAFAMRASLVGNKLQAVIDFILPDSPQKIFNLHFGEGYQLFNGSFETFKNANGVVVEEEGTYAEPEYWHSFISATGSYAGAAPKPYLSKDIRSGATNSSKSLLLKSTSILGIVANGTITNGRLNAGSMSATNTANHAEMNISNTAKDNSGHPFYALLNAQPDDITLWVKFKQGTANANHPYATVTATITDGTYYQDPEDKVYTNIAACAKNNKIATNGGAWQQLTIPFDYENYKSNNADTKAIMITMSTNADPGQGSKGDELYVDDVELVFNYGINSVIFNGNSIEASAYTGDNVPDYMSLYTATMTVDDTVAADDFIVETNAKQPLVSVEVVDADNFNDFEIANNADQVVVITCFSADLSKATKWLVFVEKNRMPGDVNSDRKVDISDVTALIDIILGKDNVKPYVYDHKAADVNSNGTTDISDVTALIDIILGKKTEE